MLLGWFRFGGRATAREYWRVTTISGVVFTIFMLVSGVMAAGSIHGSGFDVSHLDGGKIGKAPAGPGLLMVVGTIATVWLNYAVSARRLHDRGKSASWLIVYLGPGSAMFANEMSGGVLFASQSALLLGILTVITAGWSFIDLGYMAGTDGPNRFDRAPRQPKVIADDFAGSWADRPIEDLAGCKTAAQKIAAQGADATATRSAQRAAARKPQGFGRRGLGV